MLAAVAGRPGEATVQALCPVQPRCVPLSCGRPFPVLEASPRALFCGLPCLPGVRVASVPTGGPCHPSAPTRGEQRTGCHGLTWDLALGARGAGGRRAWGDAVQCTEAPQGRRRLGLGVWTLALCAGTCARVGGSGRAHTGPKPWSRGAGARSSSAGSGFLARTKLGPGGRDMQLDRPGLWSCPRS